MTRAALRVAAATLTRLAADPRGGLPVVLNDPTRAFLRAALDGAWCLEAWWTHPQRTRAEREAFAAEGARRARTALESEEEGPR